MLSANLAESVAEGRGKAQAGRLRKTRTCTLAHRVVGYDAVDGCRSRARRDARGRLADLTLGDMVVVRPGELIPGDGDIIWGIATVDESAITGESAPVVRESGGDRSAVTGGTRVLSDRIVVRITTKPGETFVDRMIALVEGASRQKTPNEIALNILLASLSIVFVIVVLTLNPIASYAGVARSIPVLVALLVCLIPTTIGALLLGDRHRRHGPARAAQRARDVGPGRRGRRRRHDAPARQDGHDHVRQSPGDRLRPLPGVADGRAARAAALSSLATRRPRAYRSSSWPRARHPRRAPRRSLDRAVHRPDPHERHRPRRRHQVRKGAGSAVLAWLAQPAPEVRAAARELDGTTEAIAQSGGTPLVVATLDAAEREARCSASSI